jgi:hypothetical protein
LLCSVFRLIKTARESSRMGRRAQMDSGKQKAFSARYFGRLPAEEVSR